MKIGICPSSKKTLDSESISHIIRSLEENNIEIFIDDEMKDKFSLPKINTTDHIDIFITLGGDGTLLYFINKYNERKDAKFTAINFGSLGFMADIKLKEFDTYIEDLVNKNWKVEERIMINSYSPDNDQFLCVNDVVLHRAGIKSMVQLEVTIDDEYFNTFQSDGLIISTPTGSTAYSLASGGPIVHPSLHTFVITPICPHTLSTRPFIVPDSSVIKIKSINTKDPITVTVDGLSSFPLNSEEFTTISLSEKIFKLIKFPNKNNSFYSTLRTKLGWKGSL